MLNNFYIFSVGGHDNNSGALKFAYIYIRDKNCRLTIIVKQYYFNTILSRKRGS